MKERLERAVAELLEAAGVDRSDPQLAKTPARVAAFWQREFLSGYDEDPRAILAPLPDGAQYTDDLVIVEGLSCHGLCPHHLLPFVGQATVAYLPRGRLVGLGQLGRLVRCFTQRLTLQETATSAVVAALETHLGVAGAACVIRAHHQCLGIPGDRDSDHRVTTSRFSGACDSAEMRAVLLGARA